MSDIQTCLAAFAVASWANNDRGREMADKAIDMYLASFAWSDHQSALSALKTSYLNLQLDSRVAIEIVGHIDQRIAYLPKRPRPGETSDDHSPFT
jgi:hypothetical protein